ncbi:hypothetical protein M3B46_10320 [Sphingobacterium daejeonense]|uniref:DUF1281 family ferredoxin-like fold protein n=1 Tax=Sphingobacterium daejeonense TaxID=371142 RepID=UPI0021A28F7E|nr:hypothetical protein [Sphingobacterium daejeonense]MCT1531392.1 hypothetical protein [Sphingobacterium daejeonense]
MANWCNNIVQFIGESQKIDEINWIFQAMALFEKETRFGQLPPFIPADEGHFINISVEGSAIYYETHSFPNTEVLVEIADFYQVGFMHHYIEFGWKIFGEANYEHRELEDIRLDKDDFEKAEQNGVVFDEPIYGIDIEILQHILEQKKYNLSQFNVYKR